jgi:hypothetical protein
MLWSRYWQREKREERKGYHRYMCGLNWMEKATEFWKRNVLKDWAGWGDNIKMHL